MPSEVIRTVRYDADERRLEVEFVNGRRYAYHQVPLDLAEGLRAAFSKGAFFNRRIRDRYPYSRQPGA